MPELISFKSFLSHSYSSPEVNLYFFKLFSEVAEVQFEVDKKKPVINVTRLEKMVRNADAFIGIYPFPGLPQDSANPEELKKQSRYFRLEIDLAIRSQKPAIIFYDKRYGNLVKPPSGIFMQSFDIKEITGLGGVPSYEKHKRIFASFCENVSRKMKYEETRINEENNTVALFLSSGRSDKQAVNNFIEELQTVLQKYNADLQLIEQPVSLDNKFFRLIEKVDLAIVDCSGTVASSGIPAYLHGRFIPMVRTKYSEALPHDNNFPLEEFLFGGVEVGYRKDMITWSDYATFKNELLQKLEVIFDVEARRINTYQEAKDYFQGAMKREDAVFVSYSGKDVDKAKDIINALKKHFITVFDYRDGKSIVPGQPWLAEIFEKLSASAIGINLLSESYIASGNCMHEAQKMVANADNKKLKLYPVKLYADALDLPPFFDAIQYMRRDDYGTADELINEIIKLNFDTAKSK